MTKAPEPRGADHIRIVGAGAALCKTREPVEPPRGATKGDATLELRAQRVLGIECERLVVDECPGKRPRGGRGDSDLDRRGQTKALLQFVLELPVPAGDHVGVEG